MDTVSSKKKIEETLNGLLDAEADKLYRVLHFERPPERQNTRAEHYTKKFHAKAGELTFNIPKLRNLPFETSILDLSNRYLNSTPKPNGRDA